MTKFAIYYAVERESGELACISLGKSSEMNAMKVQAKMDMMSAEFANKYSCIVLADYYGLKNQYKVPFQELPKKKVIRKNTSEE